MRYAGIDVNRNNVVLAMEVPLGNPIFHVFDRTSRSLVRQIVEYLRTFQVSHLSFEDLGLFSSIRMNYLDKNTVMENWELLKSVRNAILRAGIVSLAVDPTYTSSICPKCLVTLNKIKRPTCPNCGISTDEAAAWIVMVRGRTEKIIVKEQKPIQPRKSRKLPKNVPPPSWRGFTEPGEFRYIYR